VFLIRHFVAKWARKREFRLFLDSGTAVAGYCDRRSEKRNMKQLIKRFSGGILGLFLLLSIGMAASQTAQAQYRDRYPQTRDRDWQRQNDDWRRRDRDWDRDDRYGNFQLRQTALNAGYNEGMKAGRRDRNRGERFEYRDEGAYRSANKDYSSRLGDRNLYQQFFRQGFANGYNDGYRYY
jgi:hypothetical protein